MQPIYWKEELIGGFSVVWSTAQHRFTPEELRLAEGIALQGALAIENSRLYEGVKQQMAELKQTQAQLVQSTKLAAIGELAANIAHEINNPLTTVLGFASFIAERLPPRIRRARSWASSRRRPRGPATSCATCCSSAVSATSCPSRPTSMRSSSRWWPWSVARGR